MVRQLHGQGGTSLLSATSFMIRTTSQPHHSFFIFGGKVLSIQWFNWRLMNRERQRRGHIWLGFDLSFEVDIYIYIYREREREISVANFYLFLLYDDHVGFRVYKTHHCTWMIILGLGFINPSLHFKDHIGFRVYKTIIALLHWDSS